MVKGKTKWPGTIPKHIFNRNTNVEVLETIFVWRGRSGHDRIVVGSTTTYVITAYHH